MDKTEHRSFHPPHETREFPNGRAEILKVGGGEVGRLVFEPGWRWSTDVKPIAGTDSCAAPHTGYVISRRLATHMDDGEEMEFGPGEAFEIHRDRRLDRRQRTRRRPGLHWSRPLRPT